jgi:hypothetical protein
MLHIITITEVMLLSGGVKSMRRKRSTGKFVVPTVDEVNEEIQRKMDYNTQQTLENIDGLRYDWLALKQQESLIRWRLEQLGKDIDGKELGPVSIQEKFNNGIMPQYILEANLNMNLVDYEKAIAVIEGRIRFLKDKGFTDEQISQIKMGKFSKLDWHTEDSKKVKKDEKISYTG